VETDYLFFNEQFTVLPLDEEVTYVKTIISERIKAWNVPSADQSKVRVRIKARGFSRDRNELDKIIREQIQDYKFADYDQPDISQVKISNDQAQGNIAKLVKEKIDSIGWDPKPDEPDKDDLLLVAMNLIYGGK
jgi:Zn-finger nucleic acid-binding protein